MKDLPQDNNLIVAYVGAAGGMQERWSKFEPYITKILFESEEEGLINISTAIKLKKEMKKNSRRLILSYFMGNGRISNFFYRLGDIFKQSSSYFDSDTKIGNE